MSRGDFQYELKMINGINGDPGVYIFFPHMASAILFDLGSLDALSNRDLLKVKNVYVTHCHVDHFVGFDRLLRVNIPHFRLVNLCGPEGFINNVAAKLHGYTWNLLDPGQIRFKVREIHANGEVYEAMLTSDNRFNPHPVKVPAYETIADPNGHRVVMERFADHGHMEAIILDHGTPSIAYRYHGPRRNRVDVDKIYSSGLKEGPWIRLFQLAAQDGRMDALIEIEGQPHRVDELARTFLKHLPPFSVGYLTDIVFHHDNVERCLELFRGTSLLIAESSFRHADRDRAANKKHLTSYQSALIAALCGVQWYRTFHVSGIYGEGEEVEAVIDEARNAWEQFNQMPGDRLQEALQEELASPTNDHTV